jgi:drug/metabolite transporter (DMT)-like permease
MDGPNPQFEWPPIDNGRGSQVPGQAGSQNILAVYAAAAGALLLWAGTPIAMKLAVATIDPATVGMLRAVLAGPVALTVALALGLPFPARGRPRNLLIVSGITSFAVWPTLLSVGIGLTTANHAALIIAIIPIFTGLIATIFDRAWPHLAWWAGISIAGAGTVFLIFYGGGGPPDGGATSVTGDLIILAGAIVCALGYVTGAKLSPVIGTWATTFWGLAIAAVLTTPVVAFLAPRTDWVAVTNTGWLSMGYLAFLGAITAYAAWFWALGYGGITRMSSWQLGQPVVTFVFAAILLGEAITLPLLAAGAIVLAGTALAQTPARRA